MLTLRSHTHCQVAQKSRCTTKTCQRVCLPKRTGKMPTLLKQKNARNKRKCLKMNKAQHLTMYIKHLADSADFKAVTFNKNCSGLTGLLSEKPNVSYTWPL